MPQDTPSMIAQNEISSRFGGQTVAYTLVKGDILEPANLNSMLAYEDAISSTGGLMENGDPLIERQKVTSIADIVYSANQGTIPGTKLEVEGSLMKLQNGSSSNSLRLIDKTGQVAIVNIRVAPGTQKDMENVTHILRNSSKDVTTENPQISMSSSGLPVMMVDVLGSLVPTQLKTSGLALILCALIVILIFHSIIFGLAATSVVFISIALEIGVLVLLGWPLDFMTVMVSALVIGAGIDFGIHVTHRFREEWHQGMSVDEAIRKTVGNVGKALVAAAVTTAGAFAILAISNMVFLRRFGGITALSLTFALLSSLLVLPSILAWQANRLERKAGGKKAPDERKSLL
jgi:predicted RND superfamily exporter protein